MAERDLLLLWHGAFNAFGAQLLPVVYANDFFYRNTKRMEIWWRKECLKLPQYNKLDAKRSVQMIVRERTHKLNMGHAILSVCCCCSRLDSHVCRLHLHLHRWFRINDAFCLWSILPDCSSIDLCIFDCSRYLQMAILYGSLMEKC